MRTTIDLEYDTLIAAKEIARAENTSLGKVAYSTRWRTRFHADGGQCSSVMADTVPR